MVVVAVAKASAAVPAVPVQGRAVVAVVRDSPAVPVAVVTAAVVTAAAATAVAVLVAVHGGGGPVILPTICTWFAVASARRGMAQLVLSPCTLERRDFRRN